MHNKCFCFLMTELHHVGCFQDGVPRDLPQRVHARELNARTCVRKCKDLEFKYAGLQFSYLCFCGNTYGRYGELPQEMCSSKCTSKRDSFCGGHWSNSVYKTGNCVLLGLGHVMINKLTSIFHAYVLLLIMNFVIK